jgi:hypothetical protein
MFNQRHMYRLVFICIFGLSLVSVSFSDLAHSLFIPHMHWARLYIPTLSLSLFFSTMHHTLGIST